MDVLWRKLKDWIAEKKMNSKDISSDAGLLLIKEFISKQGADKLLVKAFKTNHSGADDTFRAYFRKQIISHKF